MNRRRVLYFGTARYTENDPATIVDRLIVVRITGLPAMFWFRTVIVEPLTDSMIAACPKNESIQSEEFAVWNLVPGAN